MAPATVKSAREIDFWVPQANEAADEVVEDFRQCRSTERSVTRVGIDA
jgi:hypothetical protein